MSLHISVADPATATTFQLATEPTRSTANFRRGSWIDSSLAVLPKDCGGETAPRELSFRWLWKRAELLRMTQGSNAFANLLRLHRQAQLFNDFNAGTASDRQEEFATSPLFSGLSTLAPEFVVPNHIFDGPLTAVPPPSADLGLERSIYRTVLKAPKPNVPAPWEFEGNGGEGVKTWLSDSYVLEINPLWLTFAMFDSLALDMTEQPPGPGQSEPQPWRSTFTVGLGTDWQFTQNLALHAGYRFYDNAMPEDSSSGAYPNASQHVMAMAVSLKEGPHSLSLIYGLDVLDPASSAGISSARQGNNLDSLAHLVSFTYNYSF